MVLMFTDIVGSVDLRRRIGDTAAAKIISKHDEMFRKTVSAFAFAEILKDLGDGFLARFSSASDAVHAALHFQNCLHGQDWDGEKLRARVGLHLGEVSETEIEATTGKPKLSGMAVDIAARVMGLSLPGQILMTRAAFDNARQYVREHQSATDDSPAVTRKWMAHGRYLFKGAEEPLEIFEVGEVGVAPLGVPPDSDKARRAVAADQEETLGWRPAVGMPIPERKNWVLERRLGEGGFGEVWLGEHTQSKARRVFKFCFDAERLRSFKRELMLFRLLRDALGDRNDIAKLHEVQMDTPPFYLESEFTEDGSLVEWAASKGGIQTIPLETRLDLVARTAIAVAAAHSVGILHKDIKPSNILIYREHDGSFRPRLTDFGIGELTDPTELAKRNIMVTGMSDSFMSGSGGTTTRVYAPPEVLVGKPFTIQGDVYGLGVLLYQMVIGDLERPIAEGWERDIPDPLLREDISRCVEGHPDQRLGSAQELAERLQTLPARRRALRRKQVARISMFASVVFAVLLLASGAWVFRERQAKLEKQEEARKANAVLDFMVGMFSAVDPRVAPGEGPNVKVVEKLDQAVSQLDSGQLKDDPEVESAVRWALGNSYKALQRWSDSEALLRQALEARRARDNDTVAKKRELAQTMEDYGAVRWFQRHFDDAEKLFQESWDIRRAVFGEESLEAASSMNYLAATYDRIERHDEAEKLYRRSLAIREKFNEIDLVARSKNNLGTCLRDQKRFDEAESLFREAIELIKRKHGAEHVDVGNGLNNHALCMYLRNDTSRNDMQNAEKTYRQALAVKLKALNETHAGLAVTYEGLAKTNLALNNLEEAETFAKDFVRIRSSSLPGHTWISQSLDLLAEIQMAREKFGEAEQTLKAALANREMAQRPDEAEMADVKSRLGASLAAQKKDSEAETLLRSSYETLVAMNSNNHQQIVANARDRLATFYENTDRAGLASALRNSSTQPKQITSP